MEYFDQKLLFQNTLAGKYRGEGVGGSGTRAELDAHWIRLFVNA
jgi:hypothetical protein